MDYEKTGAFIRARRLERGLTQEQLAQRLHVTGKAVSKWERALAFPDVGCLRALAEVLDVDLGRLLEGDLREQEKENGNMRKLCFYRCPTCGGILTSTGKAEVVCCGRPLEPLRVQEAEGEHLATVEAIEEDWYVTFPHSMEKDHYICFAACANSHQLLLDRLYPEQGSEARFPAIRGGSWLYLCCNQHGLFRQKI